MNINEIYVLNRALDGKNVFSLPRFSEMQISELLVNAIKDGLISKGILEEYNSFTDEGVRTVARLKKFKDAKKHIKIDNISIGVINDRESVLLLYNQYSDDYKIFVVDSSDAIKQLIEAYDFLSCSEEDGDWDNGINVAEKEFDKMYNPNSSSSFKLLMEIDGSSIEEMYFYDDGKIKVYDYNTNRLYSRTTAQVIEQLNERMGENGEDNRTKF